MITELIMTIGFIFNDGEKGKRIVGGAEPIYSINDLSWLNFTGKEIMVQTTGAELFFKVKQIDVFSSISGAVNIGLTLEENEKFNDVSIGDKVFKITESKTSGF